MSMGPPNMLSHSVGALSLGTNSALVVFGLVSLNDLATVVGLICGITTCIVNWYYRRREDRRREREAKKAKCQ